MHARVIATAVAALVSTSAFAAEPAKTPAPSQAQPRSSSAPLVLASAADVPSNATASDQQVPTTPKRRVAPRVTSCRCGDQQAQPEQ
jgi:hypothetical protein